MTVPRLGLLLSIVQHQYAPSLVVVRPTCALGRSKPTGAPCLVLLCHSFPAYANALHFSAISERQDGSLEIGVCGQLLIPTHDIECQHCIYSIYSYLCSIYWGNDCFQVQPRVFTCSPFAAPRFSQGEGTMCSEDHHDSRTRGCDEGSGTGGTWGS